MTRIMQGARIHLGNGLLLGTTAPFLSLYIGMLGVLPNGKYFFRWHGTSPHYVRRFLRAIYDGRCLAAARCTSADNSVHLPGDFLFYLYAIRRRRQPTRVGARDCHGLAETRKDIEGDA